MQILKDFLEDYIFLSREISLPLQALQIINERISFSQVLNFSENKFRKLLTYFKESEKIPIRKIDEKVKFFAKNKNFNTFERIKKNLQICEKNDIKCLSYFDNDFPQLLKSIKKPPKLIFIKGEIKLRDEKAVAIIGTRTPTQYGRKMTKLISKRFSQLGFTIVSGFARGIDTLAMKTALDNGGRAIGVIASGILNLYPKENEVLVDKLVSNGALISERFPLKSVNKVSLQIRNRITSGIGLGNIFVEGTKFSGTKWQFKFGQEQGKPAIAVEPINLDSEQAYIPDWIINEKKGYKISTIEDIDSISEILMEEYACRKRRYLIKKKKVFSKQKSLLKY
ncbi:hypothetical protein LCGC14_1004720 [marine sediment metagenome]|uniref:Smf/DprA SLOG domain-containing protein n=1 Tax=marine sediment metagenome TaxID=412755 RepID=A0A0F9QKA6_9ZZZZ|nr:DNA-processing protein DprA [archaeon]HEA70505.1 DNA-processing protein DprA [archaeon]